jgi:hypothetical protein
MLDDANIFETYQPEVSDHRANICDLAEVRREHHLGNATLGIFTKKLPSKKPPMKPPR